MAINQTSIEQDLACAHCGDLCDDGTIESGEHVFCCHGCKAVYELIDQAGLKKQYDQTGQRQESIQDVAAKRKYAFLEKEEILKGLYRFRDGQVAVVRLHLPGVHCSACIYLLEHLPKLEPAILRSEVNFVRKEITIMFRHQEKSLRDIAVLLAQLGYPPDVSADRLTETQKHWTRAGLGIKIAVAGFCFGNSMLISMPEYLDSKLLLSEEFKSLFGFINLFLALPVVFYSGWNYFRTAWQGLKQRSVSLDLPIAIGILALFGQSAWEILSGTGSGYVDSLTGLIFFLLIGKWYQGRTYQALSFEREYTSYFPVSVTVLINESEKQKLLNELVRGDLVVLHHDELIPADGVLEHGQATLDYSFVTGEAEPVTRQPGEMLYAGGRHKGAPITMRVEKPVKSSELTRLWNKDIFNKSGRQLRTLVDRNSKYFVSVVLTVATVAAIYWSQVQPDKMWQAVAAVLIVACPCALALTLPFAYGHAMRALGRKGVYLKNADVTEALAEVDTIIFDKTGTLTTNRSEEVQFVGKATPYELQLIRTALSQSSHPLSKQVASSLALIEKLPIEAFTEATGKGLKATVDGHTVLAGSADWIYVAGTDQQNEARVYVRIDTRYIGVFKIKAAYRQGIFDVLKSLHQRFGLHLLSGDNAGECERLEPFFDGLWFGQKPEDKLEKVETLPGKKLMLGDGLNDAGALRQAHVGIAVSEDIRQFSPACDAIMHSDSLPKLPGILAFARKTRGVVYGAFVISFLYNVVGLSFAVSGNLTPLVAAILMPLSSVTVVGFITLMVMARERIWLE
jgi:P-type Cu+ transporter